MSNLRNTSEDILLCARGLIVDGGYNGFSYADISSKVGIRKASIHHHFPKKVDLVRTLVAEYRKGAELALGDLDRKIPDPADQLKAYTDYWAACISDGSRPICICALLAVEIPVLPQEVAVEVRGYFRTFSAWLVALMERGAAQGKLALSDTPQTEAETFIATVHGAMLSARAYGNPTVFASITQPLIERLSAVRH